MAGQSWTITTRTGTIVEIAQAVWSDCAEIIAISEDAAARVRSLGLEPGSPPHPLAAIVAERISQGLAYLASVANAPVATLTLRWQSEPLWQDLPLDALYVHGLMVHSTFAGQDIGGALLRWAAAVAREAGKAAVRLDCMASNPALRAYYARAGFTYRGDMSLPHYTGSRFEQLVERPSLDREDPPA